jgi:hypothetical protein
MSPPKKLLMADEPSSADLNHDVSCDHVSPGEVQLDLPQITEPIAWSSTSLSEMKENITKEATTVRHLPLITVVLIDVQGSISNMLNVMERSGTYRLKSHVSPRSVCNKVDGML